MDNKMKIDVYCDETLPKDPQKRHTSILTQVNRVARLKKTT